jgi:hypothetical protein
VRVIRSYLPFPGLILRQPQRLPLGYAPTLLAHSDRHVRQAQLEGGAKILMAAEEIAVVEK